MSDAENSKRVSDQPASMNEEPKINPNSNDPDYRRSQADFQFFFGTPVKPDSLVLRREGANEL